MNKKIQIQDSIKITDSVSITMSYNHSGVLKNRIKEMLSKSELSSDKSEAIDFCISLHLLLEINIDYLFQTFCCLYGNGKYLRIDKYQVLENLDTVTFINKMIMVIYLCSFEFDEQGKQDATRYHSIIGKLKRFARIRNRLVHGHSIMDTIESNQNASVKYSKTQKELNDLESLVEEQIKDFRFIMEGVEFYFVNIDLNQRMRSGINHDQKDKNIKYLLDTSFLDDYISRLNNKKKNAKSK